MMLVLVVFLYDWRSALISAVTIPLSLTAAGLVLHLRGVTINTMILAGFVIALGAVVDDAIVDCENIVRRLRIHRKVSDDRSVPTTAKIIFDASLEVRGAVVYASMIEALALLPIFFLQGLTGSFFRPLAAGYALAVAVSTLVALISTPAMAMLLLRKAPLERRESPLVGWLQRGYDRLLAPIIRSPKPAYATVGALMVAGAVTLPLLGPSPAPDVPGAGLPDALDLRARHLGGGGAADRHRGEPRAHGDPRRTELRLPHRAGVPLGRDQRA